MRPIRPRARCQKRCASRRFPPVANRYSAIGPEPRLGPITFCRKRAASLCPRTDSTIAAPMTATPDTATARPSFADTLAVYLKPRVLIVLFLGFSAGLPLALSSSTLLVWMREVGVDLGVIGLF